MLRISISISALFLITARLEAAAYTLKDYGIVTTAELADGSRTIHLDSSGRVVFGDSASSPGTGPYHFGQNPVSVGPTGLLLFNTETLVSSMLPPIYVDTPAGPARAYVYGLFSNQAGYIVGSAWTGDQLGPPIGSQVFVYHASDPTARPQLLPSTAGAMYLEPSGINASGSIVGDSVDAAGNRRAFLSDGRTTTDLNRLIAPGSGLTLTSAVQIGDMGQIVGYATDAAGLTHEFLLTPRAAPEPSTLLGFLALGSVLYKLRRSSKRQATI